MRAPLSATAGTVTPALLAVALCAGFFLSALYAYFSRAAAGRFVRALLRAEIFSAEVAKTPEELGIKSRILTRSLRDGAYLRRVIQRAEGEENRYYIREEDRYRAAVRYEKKGNDLFALIITEVLIVALGVALFLLAPRFAAMIKTLFA